MSDSRECQSGEGTHEESGRQPMKAPAYLLHTGSRIRDHEVHLCGNPWKSWVFLRLRTADGVEGVGECSLNGLAQTTVACLEELCPCVLGQRPEDYATITRRMLTDRYSDAGQVHRGVIAAVELACLDILGKRAGLPVYALLGGKVRDRIQAYANGWYRVDRSPEPMRTAAQQAASHGYLHLKCDPFGADRSPLSTRQKGQAWGILEAVRSASPETLSVECHQRLDWQDATWLATAFGQDEQIGWFEEPLPWWNLSALGRLSRQIPVPLATGENLTLVQQFEALIAQTHSLILQPDVMNVGGLTHALAVCRLAERHGRRVCPHDAQGPVSRAACVQLAALSPAVWMLEDFDPWNEPWTKEVATTFRAEKGTIPFADMPPGLGVTIHWDEVAKHPYDPKAWLPLHQEGWEQRKGAA